VLHATATTRKVASAKIFFIAGTPCGNSIERVSCFYAKTVFESRPAKHFEADWAKNIRR